MVCLVDVWFPDIGWCIVVFCWGLLVAVCCLVLLIWFALCLGLVDCLILVYWWFVFVCF